jgi:hypothetical protein
MSSNFDTTRGVWLRDVSGLIFLRFVAFATFCKIRDTIRDRPTSPVKLALDCRYP